MKQEIFVMTNGGKFYGQADVVKGLAVHTEYDPVNKCFGDPQYFRWQITHVKTGYKLSGSYFYKTTSLKIRRKLLKIGDWNCFDSPDAFPKEMRLKARQILKKYKNEMFQ